MDRPSRKTADAASAAGLEAARAAVEQPTPGSGRGAGSTDPLIGDLRRAGLLPLLVLHYLSAERCYGNQLMERIAELTGGTVAVNPNTMYPLLRQLEATGLAEGTWEHPERRSKRYYRITDAGRAEYERLSAEIGPRLDRIAGSIEAIRSEVLSPP